MDTKTTYIDKKERRGSEQNNKIIPKGKHKSELIIQIPYPRILCELQKLIKTRHYSVNGYFGPSSQYLHEQ